MHGVSNFNKSILKMAPWNGTQTSLRLFCCTQWQSQTSFSSIFWNKASTLNVTGRPTGSKSVNGRLWPLGVDVNRNLLAEEQVKLHQTGSQQWPSSSSWLPHLQPDTACVLRAGRRLCVNASHVEPHQRWLTVMQGHRWPSTATSLSLSLSVLWHTH